MKLPFWILGNAKTWTKQVLNEKFTDNITCKLPCSDSTLLANNPDIPGALELWNNLYVSVYVFILADRHVGIVHGVPGEGFDTCELWYARVSELLSLYGWESLRCFWNDVDRCWGFCHVCTFSPRNGSKLC